MTRRRTPTTKDQKQRLASVDARHAAEPCPTTGKRSWPTRKAAKAIAKRLPPSGPRVSAYPCGDHWHIGHTPHQVRRGWTDRRTVSE